MVFGTKIFSFFYSRNQKPIQISFSVPGGEGITKGLGMFCSRHWCAGGIWTSEKVVGERLEPIDLRGQKIVYSYKGWNSEKVVGEKCWVEQILLRGKYFVYSYKG